MLARKLMMDGEAGWTPLRLSSLYRWYDMSDASTMFTDNGITNVASNDDLVELLKDKSANAVHISQAVLAQKPKFKTAVLSGKSILSFDGTDDYLVSATSNSSIQENGISIFAVMAWNGTGVGEDLPIALGTANFSYTIRSLYRSNGGTSLGFASWAGDIASSGLSIDQPHYHIFGATCSSLATNNGKNVVLHKDTSTEAKTLSSNLQNISAGIALGNIYNSASYFSSILIAEVIICSAVLDSTDTAALKNYLKTKWGTP
jgi:hypothetical protein